MQQKCAADPVGLFVTVRRCLEEEHKIVQQVGSVGSGPGTDPTNKDVAEKINLIFPERVDDVF